ncbi:MAG: translation initiation factor 2, partial [Eubacterium sp.]|nr:translation initiation factor 2 [Eubacterium sp.]
IVFIDEENDFLPTNEFASAIQDSDNYYVIVSRESFANLPYSVNEIYGIRTSGKYASLQQTYNEFYRIYEHDVTDIPYLPDTILLEDSNSGYDFFSSFLQDKKYTIVSAGGKSNILAWLKKHSYDKTLVIADGAAFGSEMDRVSQFKSKHPNIAIYLPESFEWLILSSGIIRDNHIDEILASPESYIESKEFFSWERYFTHLLTDKTMDTYLKYSKSKLNKVYLQKDIAQKIISSMKGIEL